MHRLLEGVAEQDVANLALADHVRGDVEEPVLDEVEILKARLDAQIRQRMQVLYVGVDEAGICPFTLSMPSLPAQISVISRVRKRSGTPPLNSGSVIGSRGSGTPGGSFGVIISVTFASIGSR